MLHQPLTFGFACSVAFCLAPCISPQWRVDKKEGLVGRGIILGKGWRDRGTEGYRGLASAKNVVTT